MRWKEIKEDASSARPAAGWAKELDQEIDDVDHGRVVKISQVIGDLDATLTDMANEADDQVGHVDAIPSSATTNKRL